MRPACGSGPSGRRTARGSAPDSRTARAGRTPPGAGASPASWLRSMKSRARAKQRGVEVVVMVGDHVAVHAALVAQDGGQALVPRLHRAPRRLQEVDPSGEHLTARRHTGQGPGEVVVEHGAALRQPVDVGRDGELAAVAAQVVAVQRIHHNEDGSHVLSSSVAGGRYLPPDHAARRAAISGCTHYDIHCPQ